MPSPVTRFEVRTAMLPSMSPRSSTYRRSLPRPPSITSSPRIEFTFPSAAPTFVREPTLIVSLPCGTTTVFGPKVSAGVAESPRTVTVPNVVRT